MQVYRGAGGVLSQMMDGEEHVVAYFSKKFSPPKRNYCVSRKELLAVVRCLDFFHPHLYGTKFTIRTDHAALQRLRTLKNPEGQLTRWLGKLDQLNFQIQHCPRRVHGKADSLSCRPCARDCSHCTNREKYGTLHSVKVLLLLEKVGLTKMYRGNRGKTRI